MLKDIKKRAYHHARIIEGQMRALIKAIEEEAYCIDVLTQSLAVEKSLRSLRKLVLENHLRTHVKDVMANGTKRDKEKAVEELLELYELSNVRG